MKSIKYIITIVLISMISDFACGQINRKPVPQTKATVISETYQLDYEKLTNEAKLLTEKEVQNLVKLKEDLAAYYTIKTTNPRLKPAVPVTVYGEIKNHISDQYIRLNLNDNVYIIIRPKS